MPLLKKLTFILFLGVVGLGSLLWGKGLSPQAFGMSPPNECIQKGGALGTLPEKARELPRSVSSKDSFFMVPQVWNIPFVFPPFFREPYGRLALIEGYEAGAEGPSEREKRALALLGQEALEEVFISLAGSGKTFLWERYAWLSPDLREEKRPQKELMPPGGMVIILVDDVGNSVDLARQFGNFSFPLTWAILPDVAGAEACGIVAEERGVPYLVHMPMQALSDVPGSYWYNHSWIVEGMGVKAMEEKIDLALERLPKAVGMNNHRGSLATANPFIMKPFMVFLKERGLFFLDSRTNAQSCAARIAAAEGMPLLQNHAFLDHKEEETFFREALQKLFHRASKRGWAVGICHARPWTYAMLTSIEESLREEPRLGTLPQLVDFLRNRESHLF